MYGNSAKYRRGIDQCACVRECKYNMATRRRACCKRQLRGSEAVIFRLRLSHTRNIAYFILQLTYATSPINRYKLYNTHGLRPSWLGEKQVNIIIRR